jgi:hypothetical protein
LTNQIHIFLLLAGGMIFSVVTDMKNELDFDKLTLDQRAAIVWSNGTFVDALMYFDQTISLYSVNTEFIEVWSDPHDHHITRILKATEDRLSKFLASVNLGKVFRSDRLK